MSKYEKNYTPTTNYWSKLQQASEEVISVEVQFDRKHLTNFLEDKKYSSLTSAVVAPAKNVSKRFNTTQSYGFREPVVVTSVPITEELEAATQGRELLRHLTQACKAVVDEEKG